MSFLCWGIITSVESSTDRPLLWVRLCTAPDFCHPGPDPQPLALTEHWCLPVMAAYMFCFSFQHSRYARAPVPELFITQCTCLLSQHKDCCGKAKLISSKYSISRNNAIKLQNNWSKAFMRLKHYQKPVLESVDLSESLDFFFPNLSDEFKEELPAQMRTHMLQTFSLTENVYYKTSCFSVSR